jgi:hypothetical protein
MCQGATVTHVLAAGPDPFFLMGFFAIPFAIVVAVIGVIVSRRKSRTHQQQQYWAQQQHYAQQQQYPPQH